MKKYIVLIFGCFFLLGACSNLIAWFSRDTNPPAVQRYRSLVAHASPTEATIGGTFSGEVFTMNKVAVDTTFNIPYEYTVAGQTYTGSYKTNKMPASATLKIYYDSTNPAMSDRDPAKGLKAAENNASSNVSLYVAIFCLLVFAGCLMKFREKRQQEKDEEAAQDERLRVEREAFMRS